MSLHSRRTKRKRCRYGLVKRWHIWYAKLGLFGGHKWTVPYDFDNFRPSFTSPLFDSKPSGFCGCYGTYRGSGTLYFTVPSPIYEPFSPSIPIYAFGSHPVPSAFTYDFDDSRYSFTSSLFDSKSSDFCGCYGSYSGFWHTLHFTLPSSIYGSLLRFTVPFSDFRFPLPIFEPPPTSFKTSNACITAVIAEVLAHIFRTILGAFSGCFEWCFGHDSYNAAEREREYFLVLWARLVSKSVY
jgi:hypothetical protein